MNLTAGGDLFPGTVSFIIFMDSEYTYVKSSCPPMLQKVPADRRVAVASWMLLSLKPEMLVVEDMSIDKRWVWPPHMHWQLMYAFQVSWIGVGEGA